jgi:hypothetical protein
MMSDEYSLVYNRLKLNSKQIMVVPNKKDKSGNSWAIRVCTNDEKPKNLDFIFNGSKAKTLCEQMKSVLDSEELSEQ